MDLFSLIQPVSTSPPVTIQPAVVDLVTNTAAVTDSTDISCTLTVTPVCLSSSSAARQPLAAAGQNSTLYLIYSDLQ